MAKKVQDWYTAKNPHSAIKTEWADGNVWECSQHEDFDVKVATFRTYLYRFAADNDMQVRTDMQGTSIRFQFLPSDADDGDDITALEDPADLSSPPVGARPRSGSIVKNAAHPERRRK